MHIQRTRRGDIPLTHAFAVIGRLLEHIVSPYFVTIVLTCCQALLGNVKFADFIAVKMTIPERQEVVDNPQMSFGFTFNVIDTFISELYWLYLCKDCTIVDVGGANGRWGLEAILCGVKSVLIAEVSDMTQAIMENSQKYIQLSDIRFPVSLMHIPPGCWNLKHPVAEQLLELFENRKICRINVDNMLHYMTPCEVINFLKFSLEYSKRIGKSVLMKVNVINMDNSIEHKLIYARQVEENHPYPGDITIEKKYGMIVNEYSTKLDSTDLPGRPGVDAYPELSHIVLTQEVSERLDFNKYMMRSRMFYISPDVFRGLCQQVGINVLICENRFNLITGHYTHACIEIRA